MVIHVTRRPCGFITSEDRRAVDQGSQASGEVDTVQWPSVPIEPGAAVAEGDRPQPREHVRLVLPGRIDGGR